MTVMCIFCKSDDRPFKQTKDEVSIISASKETCHVNMVVNVCIYHVYHAKYFVYPKSNFRAIFWKTGKSAFLKTYKEVHLKTVGPIWMKFSAFVTKSILSAIRYF